jgi:hypothetical protein
MKHPLGKFHRPRVGAGLCEAARGHTGARRLPAGVWLAGQGAPAEELDFAQVPAKPSRRVFVRLPPPERPRRRWYQYSLRTLLLLMLIVCLFMSWHAVQVKRAIAQKTAVAAILDAGGSVTYDFQIDKQGNMIKGATGPGPAWLRDLLGPEYFDSVSHVSVLSVAGMDATTQLPRLKSLNVLVCGNQDDPLSHFHDVSGMEELEIVGEVTDADVGHLRGLACLRRLSVSCSLLVYAGAGDPPAATKRKPMTGAGLAGLTSCPNLRELIISDSDLDPLALKRIASLSRLEKLALKTDYLRGSDIRLLRGLSALRELDLSGCSMIDNEAAPYLQKMTNLRVLRLTGTAISIGKAEQIDDALPDCRVIYETKP